MIVREKAKLFEALRALFAEHGTQKVLGAIGEAVDALGDMCVDRCGVDAPLRVASCQYESVSATIVLAEARYLASRAGETLSMEDAFAVLVGGCIDGRTPFERQKADSMPTLPPPPTVDMHALLRIVREAGGS